MALLGVQEVERKEEQAEREEEKEQEEESNERKGSAIDKCRKKGKGKRSEWLCWK